MMKRTVRAAVPWVLVGLLSAAVCVLSVLYIRSRPAPPAGQPEPEPLQEAPAQQAPSGAVLRCGSYTMDNTELGYYYWSEYFYLKGAAGDYLSGSVDFSRPLSEQSFGGGQTWQDYLLDSALSTATDTLNMVFAAREAGFTLSADGEASLEGVLAQFEDYAVGMGFVRSGGSADVEAYLRDSYGPEATLAGFRQYLEDAYLASAYSDHLFDGETCTEKEISDYFAAHRADYPGLLETDAPMARAVVLEFSAYEDNAAMAATVLSGWQADGADPAKLTALSQQYCAQPASEAEVHQWLYPAAVTDWLFDSRTPGDSTVMAAADGSAYLLYYAGQAERAWWQLLAEEDLRTERYRSACIEIGERYPWEIFRENIVLTSPNGLYATEE